MSEITIRYAMDGDEIPFIEILTDDQEQATTVLDVLMHATSDTAGRIEKLTQPEEIVTYNELLKR